MSYSSHSRVKRRNYSSLIWIAAVLLLILLSSMVIVACDETPGINGNGSNNGVNNNNNNKNNSCNGVNNCNNNYYTNPGNGSQSGGGNQSSSPNNQQCSSFNREDLGLWVYNGNRPPFPPPPGECQVIVAHGDINDSGTCHIRVFHTGEPIGNLGNGTFRLVRITGSSEQIQQEINNV